MSEMVPIALGFKAGRGGSVVVGVAADGPEPRVVLSTYLRTATEGDRLAFEPYHVAVEMVAGTQASHAEAEAAIAEGRQRQDALAKEGLQAIVEDLRKAGHDPKLMALLINRTGWLTDPIRLAHSLSAPEHPPVIEGLAVRDALRAAFATCGLEAVEMDEKSLPESAAMRLSLSPAYVQGLGATVGRPWRKEQKLACLAAWVAAASL